jgi:hypothetical protein
MRLSIAAGVRAFESNDDFCECEAEEMEDMAESIDDVRGIVRFPGRSPVLRGRAATGELGEDFDG